MMASSGGGNGGPDTRKPFTYCPGGINFSELKSPRMARRIAKHQAQMEPAAAPEQQLQAQQQAMMPGSPLLAKVSI